MARRLPDTRGSHPTPHACRPELHWLPPVFLGPRHTTSRAVAGRVSGTRPWACPLTGLRHLRPPSVGSSQLNISRLTSRRRCESRSWCSEPSISLSRLGAFLARQGAAMVPVRPTAQVASSSSLQTWLECPSAGMGVARGRPLG